METTADSSVICNARGTAIARFVAQFVCDGLWGEPTGHPSKSVSPAQPSHTGGGPAEEEEDKCECFCTCWGKDEDDEHFERVSLDDRNLADLDASVEGSGNDAPELRQTTPDVGALRLQIDGARTARAVTVAQKSHHGSVDVESLESQAIVYADNLPQAGQGLVDSVEAPMFHPEIMARPTDTDAEDEYA